MRNSPSGYVNYVGQLSIQKTSNLVSEKLAGDDLIAPEVTENDVSNSK